MSLFNKMPPSWQFFRPRPPSFTDLPKTARRKIMTYTSGDDGNDCIEMRACNCIDQSKYPDKNFPYRSGQPVYIEDLKTGSTIIRAQAPCRLDKGSLAP